MTLICLRRRADAGLGAITSRSTTLAKLEWPVLTISVDLRKQARYFFEKVVLLHVKFWSHYGVACEKKVRGIASTMVL